MDPLRIASLARRIVTQCLRDRRTFGLIIIVPSLVMTLLGYFYTTSTSNAVIIGVVDEDAGLGSLRLSRDVVDALKEQDSVSVVEVSRAEVDQSLKDKKIDGAVMLGPGFTGDVILGQKAGFDVVTEGTDQGKNISINMKARNATISALTKALQDLGGYAIDIDMPAPPANAAASNAALRLGVASRDEGLAGVMLSGKIISALSSQSNLTVVAIDGQDINGSIRDEKLNAALVIGPGFTRDVYESHAVNMQVVAQAPAVPGNLSDPRNLSLYQQGQLSYAQNLSAIGGKLQNATASVLSDIAKGGGLTVDAGSAAVYAGGYSTLDLFAPYLLGIIAFVFVFIFTGVTFLRERSFGTFERLLVSPLSRAEIIIGYMLGFSVFAIIQSAIILGFAIFVLQVKVAGDIYSVVVLQLLLTIVGVNLGILCSSFAKNELQAVQFIPLLILPQIFLDGMFWPIATLPGYLQAFSYIMPLTYANDALQNIMVRGQGLGDVWLDVAALLLFAVVTIALSTLSLNKQLQ